MTALGGTRALVTGATSGLGLAMARALVDAGARVAVTSRDAARAENAAAALGPGALGLALDVRDEDAVTAGVAEVWERMGGIDLLVNNAGIGMRTVNPRFLSYPQPFWEVTPDDFRDVLETKATGCFLMTRAVVPSSSGCQPGSGWQRTDHTPPRPPPGDQVAKPSGMVTVWSAGTPSRSMSLARSGCVSSK